MGRNHKPDFICISPHKTGTTWLYMTLKAHPNIWLPPQKELWVLNRMGESYLKRWYNFFYSTGMSGDIRKNFERDVRIRLKQTILTPQNLAVLYWWFKFLVLPYNFHTYHHLFSHKSNLLCGDITPNYYFIKPELLQRLSQHNPDTRIIIVLRDPMERAWSYTRMTISDTYHKSFQDISHSEFIQHFDQIHSWWKPYLPTIRTWSMHFHQVYVGYYDTLEEDPFEFYRQICDFLEIDSFQPQIDVRQVVNRSKAERLPPELHKYLGKQYINEIYELAEWSGSPFPRKWLKRIQESFEL